MFLVSTCELLIDGTRHSFRSPSSSPVDVEVELVSQPRGVEAADGFWTGYISSFKVIKIL